jgi:hypothetical protein
VLARAILVDRYASNLEETLLQSNIIDGSDCLGTGLNLVNLEQNFFNFVV